MNSKFKIQQWNTKLGHKTCVLQDQTKQLVKTQNHKLKFPISCTYTSVPTLIKT